MIMTPALQRVAAARDAQDALRALASMPGSRGEILQRPPSIFAGDTMRASLEATNILRTKVSKSSRHSRSLPGLQLPLESQLPLKPSQVKALAPRQPKREQVARNPVTGEGINEGGMLGANGRPQFFTYKEVPFGAKSSVGRKLVEGHSQHNPFEWPGEDVHGADRFITCENFARPSTVPLNTMRYSERTRASTPSNAKQAFAAAAPAAAALGSDEQPVPLSEAALAAQQEALKLGRSGSAMSSHRASKKRHKLEYQLWREQARKQQAERELHATLSLVPSFGTLDVSALRETARRTTGGGLDGVTLTSSLTGAAGELGRLESDKHWRPQRSRRHKPEEFSLTGIFSQPDESRRGKVFAYTDY